MPAPENVAQDATTTSSDQGKWEKMKELSEAHEKSGYLTPTLNNAGWQINALDEYGQLFVEYAKTCKKPILDFGVAFGFTTKALLSVGATVVANEISQEMLNELEKSVPEEQKQRLTLEPGNMMDLNFPEQEFDGIWANRCLHFLRPDEIRTIIPRFFKWLAPGGKLCITAASPYFLECDFEKYTREKENGKEWPGFQENPSEQKVVLITPFTHWLDAEVLQRELEMAGFVVEKCSYLPRPYAQTNGKEGVGIIGVKPQ